MALTLVGSFFVSRGYQILRPRSPWYSFSFMK